MSEFAIIRIAKLPSYRAIASSAQHAFRERDTPNADPAKLKLNDVTGATSSEAVVAAIRSRISELDQAQPQGVKCIEYLISTSPKAFHGVCGPVLEDDYFSESLQWIKLKHEAENVVCSVVHRDETTPHMSVYVVPVVQREARTRKRSVSIKGGGREVREFPVPARAELSAKHFFGDRVKLSQLQTDFADQVGGSYGLERGKHRAFGSERIDHKTVKQFWADMDRLRREITVQAAALEVSRAKLEDGQRQFEADKAGGAAKRSLLDTIGHDLDRLQAALKDREAAVEGRIELYNSNVLIFKTKQERFSDDVRKFKEYRQGVKDLVTKLDTQRREFVEVTRGHTPDQVKKALDYLDKERVKSR